MSIILALKNERIGALVMTTDITLTNLLFTIVIMYYFIISQKKNNFFLNITIIEKRISEKGQSFTI